MARKNSQGQRLDQEFIKEMKTLAKMRYLKNLAKKEPSFREMTNLLRRTQGYKQSVEELKTKPKRKNEKVF